MKALVASVILSGCAAAPCHQALTSFCEHCPGFDEIVSPADPMSGCKTIKLLRCEGRRSLVIPGKASTQLFFDDQGALVGAEQSVDTFADCSPQGTTQSWGDVFDCTGASEQLVCRK